MFITQGHPPRLTHLSSLSVMEPNTTPVSYLDQILSEKSVRVETKKHDGESSDAERVKRDVEERSKEFLLQIKAKNQDTELVRGDRINFVTIE